MKEIANRGAATKVTAHGSSMSPLIKNNDQVWIQPVQPDKLIIGQVAAFRRPPSGALLVHRLVKTSQGQYWFKGDNNPGPLEGPATSADILGVVSAVERNGKPVRFGLGGEKRILAGLSRCSLLPRVFRLLRAARAVLGGEPIHNRRTEDWK